jgi:murein L,D-transpeptidase YafK
MSVLLLASVLALSAHGSDSTRAISRPAPAPAATDVIAGDSLVLEKRLRQLTLFRQGEAVRTYTVALGRNSVGDKERVGDYKTPEGVFRIVSRNANSQYHMALKLSYPDSAHRARAAALGVSPGGEIMIHGLPNGLESYGLAHLQFNWTKGCIAVTNEEIEQIWRAIPDGTPIEIKP